MRQKFLHRAKGLAWLLLGLLWAGPAWAQSGPSTDPTGLTSGVVARGSANIAVAWLADPVSTYDHFAFGEPFHPQTLRVKLSDGTTLSHTLPPGQVFEDRIPRLADMDGDGTDELVLIVADAVNGAAVTIFDVSPNGLEPVAQVAPTGRAHRWMNVAAIADLDGDGAMEIALVRMPHLLKRLEVWRFDAPSASLSLQATRDDVSNHRYGSLYLGLSGVADFAGTGSPQLAIPSGDRVSIHFLALEDGTLTELGRTSLPAPADGDFTVTPQDGRPTLSVPLEDGRTVPVLFPAP